MFYEILKLNFLGRLFKKKGKQKKTNFKNLLFIFIVFVCAVIRSQIVMQVTVKNITS